ncbi:MAG TPA: RluA family pseudouridine synthase [Caulobacteraceae bacterium]|jgi:tRNA pseudouridine32 synthase/23S rRNA pseudouridine746 synthase
MARAKPLSLTAEEIAFVTGLVIHKDDELLALDKPAGISSQGGRIDVNTLDELLGAFAKPSGVRPRLVHRLDRDTSGVLLAARSQPAAAYMGKMMMGRRIRKTYLAVVAPGAPVPREGLIEAALLREDIGRESRVKVVDPTHPEAKAAATRFRTLAANDCAALVELRPQTGRMHQLRVHLAHIGRPIAGDARYGGALVLAGAPVSRLMLHAASLTFPHPNGGKETRIDAAMPPDMRELTERLGLRTAETV